jgi:heme ABC exporter ATP-binding subunit CcmA
VSKRFGPAVALEALDLELEPGASLGVLGPNGAGKSTLLRLLAGLARPSAGELQVDGQSAHAPAARARVGYLGHATLLYAALTAFENLVLAGRLHGVAAPAERARALLEEEGLAAAADRPVAGLSRGTAQRVAIARGLVHEPGLVLLDEPFTGLDRSAARRLAGRLERLREAGRTLVLVTHDVAQAAGLVDSVLVLVRGRVAHRGQGRLGATELEQAYLGAVEAAG